jgi:hypothetical protein
MVAVMPRLGDRDAVPNLPYEDLRKREDVDDAL